MKNLLQNLPSHPRLLLLQGAEQTLRANLTLDPRLAAVWQVVQATADAYLTAPPLERILEGRRLLYVSRECLKRVLSLSLAYRLTNDLRYARRATADMLAVAAFSDWGPLHFLDVAEMTAGIAIGVDWLHDTLDPATRSTLHAAIIQKGLQPSLTETWWPKAANNWNQVCHAGMVLGALATAEDNPQLAEQILARAVEGLPYSMQSFAPHGAYPEGPMYWNYGTTFNILLLDALQKALGSDLGLSQLPGFNQTAEYFLQVAGPTGLWFNYADCDQRGNAFSPCPTQYWFANRQHNPSLLWHEQPMLDRLLADPSIAPPAAMDRLFPMLLVWAQPQTTPLTPPAATSYFADGITPVALFRSNWTPNATFVGLKGGRANGPHGHMDAGTFVLDALGQRWAEDLDKQDYHSVESLGLDLWNSDPNSDRWRIFRLGPTAHNTLMVNHQNHQVAGNATFTAHSDRSATLDLSPVFATQLASASRSVLLHPDAHVTLTDQIQTLDQPTTIRWAMLTSAQIELTPTSALLHKNGQTLRLQVQGLPNIKLQTYTSNPPPSPYDSPNPGTQILGFETQLAPHQTQRWQVEFTPQPRL